MRSLTLSSSSKAMFIAFLAVAFLALSPEMSAFADPATATAIENSLCFAVNQLTGGIGRAIAVLVIISVAIMLFLGKVSWGLGIAIAVAMGLLFGAKSIVNIFGADAAGCGG